MSQTWVTGLVTDRLITYESRVVLQMGHIHESHVGQTLLHMGLR